MTRLTESTTAIAQDRLLEAIAAMQHEPEGIEALIFGLRFAEGMSGDDTPQLTRVWQRLQDLAKAVNSDLDERDYHHA